MSPGPRAPGPVLAAFGLLLARLSSSSAVPDVPGFAALFGTKTRYQEVNPNPSADPSVLRPPPGERCVPVHVTAVVRHGTRYPTSRNIRRILELSELLTGGRRDPGGAGGQRDPGGAGGQRDPGEAGRLIRDRWECWYTEDMDGQLVPQGRAELRQLARRLAALFPALLSEHNVRKRSVSFVTSSKHRCVSSVEAFQEGLHQHWGRHGAPDYAHRVDDELMRFFERCRGYVEGVETNRTALLEVEKFRHGDEMEAVRRRVAEKLGVAPQRLTPDLVETAFFLCSYELSIRSVHSPWCLLFEERDAQVLEFLSDLQQYWKRSHGHAITGLSSCPLFHHVFRTLDKAGRPRRSTDPPPEPASILVGHGETLLPLLALLGLYKDQTPPTASNYHSQHGRQFRSSRIVPYAANLLLVLFDCQRGPRLQLLLNEAPVRFPGLAEDAPLYRDVRAAYRHLLDGCDSRTECEVRPGARGPSTEL
ncbi:multiple inositol polyphosphate phosphatase 1b [Cololabis saira]|uniref:multiple inositol polyphosphate phosphatase 1b n=1 Tax=Cololabis saira TaxID=129043 RepID=UPI002AD209B8|nr:multiple inositol polyphosphate phosphatase 1b [Cololabis saira]